MDEERRAGKKTSFKKKTELAERTGYIERRDGEREREREIEKSFPYFGKTKNRSLDKTRSSRNH